MCKSRPTGSCRLSGCGLQDSIVECIAQMHYLEDQTYGKELVLRSKQIPTPMPNREHSMKNSKNKTNSTKRGKNELKMPSSFLFFENSRPLESAKGRSPPSGCGQLDNRLWEQRYDIAVTTTSFRLNRSHLDCYFATSMRRCKHLQ